MRALPALQLDAQLEQRRAHFARTGTQKLGVQSIYASHHRIIVYRNLNIDRIANWIRWFLIRASGYRCQPACLIYRGSIRKSIHVIYQSIAGLQVIIIWANCGEQLLWRVVTIAPLLLGWYGRNGFASCRVVITGFRRHCRVILPHSTWLEETKRQ